MTRTGTIRWISCAVVTLLAADPTASSQSLVPDAHGFLLAQPEVLKPISVGRSMMLACALARRRSQGDSCATRLRTWLQSPRCGFDP